MQMTILPNTMIFKGVLDEETTVGDFQSAFEKLKTLGITPPVSLDFSQVNYGNSVGLLGWLKFLAQTKNSFKYVNAPIWMINQFNTIKGYFENGSYVESVQAPYFCSKTQDSRSLTLVLGKDVPVLDNYTQYSAPNRSLDGKVFEVDFEPSQYFSFISENFKEFKAKIA
jgi:hypothetical protein